MKGSFSTTSNEAIASVSMGYFIKRYGTISISKLLLFLPFILHPQTVRKLRGTSLKRSIEEFMLKNPECFITFNARYFDFLPLSINAITILYEINVLHIVKDKISIKNSANFFPEMDRGIGKRASDNFPAIDTLVGMFADQTESSLYLKLKIEL